MGDKKWCPVEKLVRDALIRAGVEFKYETDFSPEERQAGVLDFYLPESDTWIECKQFHADRVVNQLRDRENVILIQGMDAARAFFRLLVRHDRYHED